MHTLTDTLKPDQLVQVDSPDPSLVSYYKFDPIKVQIYEKKITQTALTDAV